MLKVVYQLCHNRLAQQQLAGGRPKSIALVVGSAHLAGTVEAEHAAPHRCGLVSASIAARSTVTSSMCAHTHSLLPVQPPPTRAQA